MNVEWQIGELNTKHLAALAGGLSYGILTLVSPGETIAPFMPWALPAVVFVVSGLIYIWVDFWGGKLAE